MDNALTIGELSKEVGLPTKTIRFYEEQGIISQAKRGENGYRMYDQSAVEELQLIKNVRDLGLPLTEIKKLMVGCNDKGNCHHTKRYIETEIEAYLQKLQLQIKQFKILEERLSTLKNNVHKCDENDQKNEFCCDILHQLVSPSLLERNRDEKGKK